MFGIGGTKHIVIIEDESDLGMALTEALEGKGFHVSLAKSGEEGLEKIRTEKPDVILLDTILPGISGLEVLQELAPMRKETNIPVIMLSNVDNPEDLKRAREYDIYEYMVKTDWRLEDVIKKIKEAV